METGSEENPWETPLVTSSSRQYVLRDYEPCMLLITGPLPVKIKYFIPYLQ